MLGLELLLLTNLQLKGGQIPPEWSFRCSQRALGLYPPRLSRPRAFFFSLPLCSQCLVPYEHHPDQTPRCRCRCCPAKFGPQSNGLLPIILFSNLPRVAFSLSFSRRRATFTTLCSLARLPCKLFHQGLDFAVESTNHLHGSCVHEDEP